MEKRGCRPSFGVFRLNLVNTWGGIELFFSKINHFVTKCQNDLFIFLANKEIYKKFEDVL